MRTYIEIGGHTKSPVGKRLSNFYPRQFIFDGVPCGGMEGFLQSLKCPDINEQRRIAALYGIAAKRAGRTFDSWKESQLLYWQGTQFLRTSREYTLFITRAYDELYVQNAGFRTDLLKLGKARIWHSIGKPDARDTVLTEVEMINQLNCLRLEAVQEKIAQLL